MPPMLGAKACDEIKIFKALGRGGPGEHRGEGSGEMRNGRIA